MDRFEFGPFGLPYLAAYVENIIPSQEHWLCHLPCPTLGIGTCDHRAARYFDVVVATPGSLETIIANIEAAPIAAATLVQTLRATEHLSLPHALTVESLAYATLQGGAENRVWLAANHNRPSPAPNPDPPVLIHRDQTTLTLTLNRPAAYNAVNIALRDALAEALALASLDETIRQVHLRAAGRCFSIGGALEDFGTAPDQATAHAVRSTIGPAFRLAAVADRTTAHVHGACIGAGLELAALCGKVQAQPGAFFQLPEIRFGLIPGSGGTAGLARRIGRQRTAYMALSARRINTAQALSWGLIDSIA